MKRLLHKDPDHHDNQHHHHHTESCNDKNCQHEHHHHHHHEHKHEHFVESERQPVFPRKDQNQLSFENFLTLFPEAEFPISITSDTQRLISSVQQPLSALWASRFLLPEGTEVDEFTEYMACFSLPKKPKYLAIIYWEASLIGSSYYMVTFTKGGLILDHQRIAGTLYTDNEIIQTICTIQYDGSIHQMEAKLDAHSGKILNNEKPKQIFLEITEEGKIVED